MNILTATSAERKFTLEEWTEYEDPKGNKYEFKDGELILIVENSVEHGRIISNSTTALHNNLRSSNSKCWTSAGSQKFYFKEYNDGAIPDVAIICEKPLYKEGSNKVLVNPTLVIEVLSPSTEDYDRGGKFARYRSLSAFKEYVLVSQSEPKVETWYKLEENVWRIARFEGMEAVMKLDSIDCEIPLSDIYFQIDFAQAS